MHGPSSVAFSGQTVSVQETSWTLLENANSLISCRTRSEEHTSELQSQSNLVCRLLLEKKKHIKVASTTTTTHLPRTDVALHSTMDGVSSRLLISSGSGRITPIDTYNSMVPA